MRGRKGTAPRSDYSVTFVSRRGGASLKPALLHSYTARDAWGEFKRYKEVNPHLKVRMWRFSGEAESGWWVEVTPHLKVVK